MFLSEESAYVFEDLLKETNEKFDHYDFIYYDKIQIDIFENKLIKKLTEMENENDYKLTGKYFSENNLDGINNDVAKNKVEIIKMLHDFIEWIKERKEDGISVLGI